jgi:hypothetical protein
MKDSVSRLFVGPAPQTVVVNTTSVTATQISLKFDTPNGNQPNDFGNEVWIWQSGNQVPWTSEGKAQSVKVNTPSGDLSFTGLNVTTLSYIIGYAVGPKGDKDWPYPNVVASVYVPALGSGDVATDDATQQGDVFSPSVDKVTFGATSLVVKYDMLSGYNPSKSGAYVGVWEGTAASYSQKPKWYEPVSSKNSSGTVSFNNIQILRGTSYTMGLFATGYDSDPSKLKQTALAATSTFSV